MEQAIPSDGAERQAITHAQLNVLRTIERDGPLYGQSDGCTFRFGRRWNIVLACERRGWIFFDDRLHFWDLTDHGRARLADHAGMSSKTPARS
jgi:hypothetical protein